MLCACGMAIAVVVGVLAGTWLAEYAGQSPYGTLVRFLNDVLLSAPSILIGLFVYQSGVGPCTASPASPAPWPSPCSPRPW